MTPAVLLAEQRGVEFKIHRYQHDSKARSYGMEAAEKLGVAPQRVLKTLILELDSKRLGVAVLPVSQQLNLKSAAFAFKAKKAVMAPTQAVLRSTGYVLGGVSPLGQKRRLPCVLDRSAMDFPSVFISAGKRGLDLELAPQDLQILCDAQLAALV